MKPLFGSIILVFGMVIVIASPGVGVITLAVGYWMLEQCTADQKQWVGDTFVGAFIVSVVIHVLI